MNVDEKSSSIGTCTESTYSNRGRFGTRRIQDDETGDWLTNIAVIRTAQLGSEQCSGISEPVALRQSYCGKQIEMPQEKCVREHFPGTSDRSLAGCRCLYYGTLSGSCFERGVSPRIIRVAAPVNLRYQTLPFQFLHDSSSSGNATHV